MTYAFERSLTIDHNRSDLPIINDRLRADKHDITIEDPGTDHAIAVSTQGIISADIGTGSNIGFKLSRRIARSSTGNTAEQRDAVGFERKQIERKTLRANSEGGHGDVKHIREGFDHLQIRLSFSSLPHTDGRGGNIEETGKMGLRHIPRLTHSSDGNTEIMLIHTITLRGR